MVLWVDKYRPRQLKKLTLHKDMTERLGKMVQAGDFPHLMLYGPSGAGKSTRVSALLREIYGPGVEKVKVNFQIFKVSTGKSSKSIEISTISSNHHIELNPSDVGRNDRYVIQEVIKEIAQTHSVNTGSQHAFKVVVLREVDRLSKAAQHALRRTMEQYMSTCRIILVCESACRVISPLRSRVLALRIPKPTEKEVAETLLTIADKESVKLPTELATKIATKSERNLRRAILMLETCRVDANENQLQSNQVIHSADWERFVDDLGKLITEEQTPKRLLLARSKIYELLTCCIPPELIIQKLTVVLLKRLDDEIKHEVVQWAAFYEHRLHRGSKPIFHLEAFVAKFMSIYKRWVAENFS